MLGDVGPSGELLAPIGVVEPDEIKAMFAAQIAALAEGGADVILVETMSDLAEVEAAVGAAAEVAPDLPVAATLTFDTHGHTMMGVSRRARGRGACVAGCAHRRGKLRQRPARDAARS